MEDLPDELLLKIALFLPDPRAFLCVNKRMALIGREEELKRRAKFRKVLNGVIQDYVEIQLHSRQKHIYVFSTEAGRVFVLNPYYQNEAMYHRILQLQDLKKKLKESKDSNLTWHLFLKVKLLPLDTEGFDRAIMEGWGKVEIGKIRPSPVELQSYRAYLNLERRLCALGV